MPKVITKSVFNREHHREMWLWLAGNLRKEDDTCIK